MTVGENIKKYRKEKGWTQKQLADKLNKNTRTIQNYENSRREPNIKLLYQIAETLHISISDLFGEAIGRVESSEKYEKELAQFLNIKEEELQLTMKYDNFSEVKATKEFLRGVVSGLNIAFDILERVKKDDKKRKDL